MDNYTSHNLPQKAQINLHETNEVEYWSEKLNVTPDEIQQVVQQVGYNVTDVEGAIKASSNLGYLDQYYF
ncbi:MAG: hypothetical protein JWN78_11 [Bacteroidota bacterium]|nr:hypothetical protein [Bacteroidota bacterium]